MALTSITIQLLRRLFVAVTIGGSIITGATAYITSTAAGTDTPSIGAVGTGLFGEPIARASGIAVSGVDRLAARPAVFVTSGTRITTEPTVRSRADLVAADDITVAATVVDGHTTAHASAHSVTYGRQNLGPISAGCRDGRASTSRTGIVRLTANTTVHYGQTHGPRATGATILVLGPGDKALRVITIATVSCSSPYKLAAPRTTTTPAAEPSTPPSGSSSTTTPPSTATSTSPTPPTSPSFTETPDASGKPSKRLVPRAPKPTPRPGHLPVTG